MVTHPSMQAPPTLRKLDPEVASAIEKEMKRQVESVLLIASESYASRAVLEAAGSVMTNKYAEGYPGARYYGGCEFVDIVESLALDRVKKLFGAEHANVQPHSGTQANMAVYFSLLKPGDTIMGMKLDHGGHLSHGSPVNFTGKMYKIIGYGVDRENQRIDFDEVERLAKENRPKIIVAGYSTYPRTVDWARFRAIADEVGAILMVDMAHIAGLVAGGAHPSPVPHAQIVTSTTHKSLRGPRAAFILSKKEFQQGIDRAVFPQVQSGPFMHIVAAKAVCFGEALEPGFKRYASQVVENAKTIAKTLMDNKFKLVSGGTDNHLMLVDLSLMNMSGKDAEEALGRANIHLNRNAIPYDTKPARVTSGIRIGTPSVTSRGMGTKEMVMIGEAIVKVLTHLGNADVEAEVRKDMIKMATSFPVPGITADRGWPG